jgi:NAD(P)-dependent dehydrogenase (short-subunit alcohol dehydrogenase family)
MASTVDKKLSGRTALVTGGSRGIGKAVAAAYAREGARVFICARNAADVELSVLEICRDGGEAAGAAGDLGDLADAQRIVRAAVERYGGLDILVNNAGLVGPRASIATYPVPAWEQVVRVNLNGSFYITQEALKVMISRGRGCIINVSSGVGRVGRARWGAYAATKFAIEGLTQVLAEELRGTAIRVNSLNPGPTRTQMRAQAYPDEDPMTLPAPDEIAPAFVYLASQAARDVTGQSLEARDLLGRSTTN